MFKNTKYFRYTNIHKFITTYVNDHTNDKSKWKFDFNNTTIEIGYNLEITNIDDSFEQKDIFISLLDKKSHIGLKMIFWDELHEVRLNIYELQEFEDGDYSIQLFAGLDVDRNNIIPKNVITTNYFTANIIRDLKFCIQNYASKEESSFLNGNG